MNSVILVSECGNLFAEDDGPSITFRGGKYGDHKLAKEHADTARINTHWEGYCHNNGTAPKHTISPTIDEVQGDWTSQNKYNANDTAIASACNETVPCAIVGFTQVGWLCCAMVRIQAPDSRFVAQNPSNPLTIQTPNELRPA